ncbi:MAG: twin-arginine translocase subunit TatC [Chloroflexota bacterium]
MGVNRVEPKPRYTEDGHGAQMGFFDHLNELRMRITRAFIGVIIGTAIGAFVAEPVLAYLGGPYLSLAEGNEFLIIDTTGTVVAYFRVALLIGATLAVPIVTYQSVMFIIPAMTNRERRFFMMAMPAVFLLFLLGVAFAWFVMIPPALRFLEGFQDGLFNTEWEASRYIQFVTSLLFWMGVAFETPLVLFVISLLGFVTAGPLLRAWRLAIVISAVAAAMITPTVDPVNMGLVMGPLIVLYLISVVLVFFGARIHRRGSGAA